MASRPRVQVTGGLCVIPRVGKNGKEPDSQKFGGVPYSSPKSAESGDTKVSQANPGRV